LYQKYYNGGMNHAPAQTPTPESLLKDVFGYEQFKPLQREVIENILRRRDTLVIMPTGGGKSLCYQIPALIFSGLTVVVSPLIALMKDQVEQLQALGVPSLFLNSSLSFEEYQENLDLVRSGKVKLLYVAPETLLTPRIFGLLSSARLDCLTIDEAHCISEWGHDFRPEYRQLVEVRERFPEAVCVALTATATQRVREDIQKSLRFELANEFVASFNRPNLLIEVAPKTDPLKQTLEFLRSYPDRSGIIYCFSRKQVDDLTAALNRHGIKALPYHAGLADWERKRNQDLFIRDDVQIIVATIAFGMGINKPNVRFVIHYDLPKSIENYYQEIGRAGRDGLPAHCLLLYSYGDVQKLKYFIDQKEGQERQVAYQHLGALTRYAESDVCRRVPLLAYFGETFTTENCGMCDVCMAGEQEQIDITIPAQKFLSCVKRTGERFGANHIADVLLGSENQKVLKFGHQNLSTYGIGKDLTRQQWHHLARQMIQKGFLEADPEYGGLRLTQRAGEALKNREPIFGTLVEPNAPAKEDLQPVGQFPHDPALFDLLRAKRKALADAARVPPYVIFPDRTLIEMATYFPQQVESLTKIHGVGTVKQERYGAIFLEIIVEYCRQRNLPERSKRTQRVRAQAPVAERQDSPTHLERDELRKPRHVVVGEAYNQGQSIDELMEAFDIQQSTILDHLTRYALDGNSLRPGADLIAISRLSEKARQTALEAFQAESVEFLRPVFERLNGSISYDELKILRLVYLSQNK
jgi:ATP-dependent DNA helicase RecQ